MEVSNEFRLHLQLVDVVHGLGGWWVVGKELHWWPFDKDGVGVGVLDEM